MADNKILVFVQTKIQGNKVMTSERLRSMGDDFSKYNIEVIHGDVSQAQREITLNNFKNGKCNILVATDVASRGLDIPNVDLIIQMHPPFEVESYIHRSGRTARAGNEGKCITFYSNSERHLLSTISSQAGVNFTEQSLPKPEQLVEHSIQNLDKQLREVDDKILNLFKETATRLILDKGALNAVSLALAHLSGATRVFDRKSLITGAKNYITMKLNTDRGIFSKGYVFDILNRIKLEDQKFDYERVTLCADETSAVFDIPSEYQKAFLESHKSDIELPVHNYYTIEVADYLPELKQDRKGSSFKRNVSFNI
jgi:ATP-dependent RNA helicase DDX21